jgi:hypothetical protein
VVTMYQCTWCRNPEGRFSIGLINTTVSWDEEPYNLGLHIPTWNQPTASSDMKSKHPTSSTLKMGAGGSSETTVRICQTTGRHTPADRNNGSRKDQSHHHRPWLAVPT